MSDAKAKDQSKEQQEVSDVQPLQAPDAQTLRLSGHIEINRVEQSRTNSSDGSLRHYQKVNIAGQKLPADWCEQNRSLELQDGEVFISRVNPLREANLASPDKKNANGEPYQVYTAEASQALLSPGEISKALTEGEYQEKTKLNVQITNVPEVSPGLSPQDAIDYLSTVSNSGVAAVRQLEHHMTEPGAINSDIEKTSQHFKQSPYQFEKDVLGAFLGVVDKIDKPMTAAQRAEAAGALMPMFFFEGTNKPLDGNAVRQMKLDQMTAQQLKELGIERVEMHMPEVPNNLRHLKLTKAEPELLSAMRSKGREFRFVEPGTAERGRLDGLGKEAAVLISSDLPDLIQLKVGAPKIAALEEFLHGTQFRNSALSELPVPIKEVHVKDFMIRHHKMLGLSENDLAVLRELMKHEIESAFRQGWTWKR